MEDPFKKFGDMRNDMVSSFDVDSKEITEPETTGSSQSDVLDARKSEIIIDGEYDDAGQNNKGGTEKASAEDLEKQKIKVEERKRRQEEIENISKEVSDARKQYLETDYNKDIKLSRIRKFFGSAIGKDKKGNGLENDGDIVFLKKAYADKLTEYKNARLLEIKEAGLSGKELDAELENVMKYVMTDERIKLYDTHTEIRKENDQKTWTGGIKEGFIKSIEGYKKLHPAIKISVSVALLAGGVGAAALGFSTAVIGIAGLRGALKLAGSLGLAHGATAASKTFFEKKSEKQRLKKNDNEIGSALKTKEKNTESEEEKIKRINNFLDGKISEADSKLQEMKKKSVKMTAGAIGVGIAAGSLSFFMGNIAHATGISDEIKSFFGGGQASNNIVQPDGIHKFVNPGNRFIPDDVSSPKAGPLGGAMQTDTLNNISQPHYEHFNGQLTGVVAPEHLSENLTIERGSSFEGTLIKYLDAHRGEFLEHHPEMGKFNAGQIAHRLAIDFMHEHPEMNGHLPDYVHDGAKLSFNPSEMKISIGLNDPHGYGWYENGIHVNAADHVSGTSSSETMKSLAGELTKNAHEQDVLRDRLTEDNDFSQEIVDAKDAAVSEVGKLESFEKFVDATVEDPETLTARHTFINSQLHDLLDKINVWDKPDTKTNVIDLKNSIFGKTGNLFQSIKDENIAEILKSDETREAFMKKLPRGGKTFFSKLVKQIPPESGEKTIKWLVRAIVKAKELK